MAWPLLVGPAVYDTEPPSSRNFEPVTVRARTGSSESSDRVPAPAIVRLQAAFEHALAVRRGGPALEHPYSDEDMIRAFATLQERTPLIRFGYVAANFAILSVAMQEHELEVLDLGIGHGAQWDAFFEIFHARGGALRHMRLLGVDVPGAARAAAAIGDRLREKAARAGVRLTFVSQLAHAERIERFDLTREAPLVVNASFAMHHVPSGDAVTNGEWSRDALLARLRALSPRLLALVEPDAEHDCLPFPRRVNEAMRHYGIVFDALEATLGDDERTRRIIEQRFFGREIVDVVACEGAARVERHERAASWRRRLTRLGYRAFDLRAGQRAVVEDARVEGEFSTVIDGRGISLCFRGGPLVHASAWASA